MQRVRALVQRAGLPVVAPRLAADDAANVEEWLHHMRVDKKAEAGEIRFVVIAQAGEAALARAPDSLVAEVITACSQG